MKTILDDGKSWTVASLAYADDLRLVLVEGIRSDKPEDVQIGDVALTDLHAVEITEESRRVEVRFARVVAWQVVDESYTNWDESEERDDTGFLVALSKSAYLKFVDEHHGWYKDMAGPAVHYRLWTEDEVIDVIAHEEPVMQLVASN